MKVFSMILATLMATSSATKLDNAVTDTEAPANPERWWGKDYEKYRTTLDDGDADNCRIYDPETGSVPNSAPTPGSAEVLGLAREEDGAVAMMAARAPHSHTRPQDWLPTAER